VVICSPDTDAERQVILDQLSTVYHSTIEPLESLYQYGVLGVNSFTGIFNCFLVPATGMIYVFFAFRRLRKLAFGSAQTA